MNENASGEAPRSTTSSDGRDARRAISRRQAIEGAVAIGVLAAFGGTVKAFAGGGRRALSSGRAGYGNTLGQLHPLWPVRGRLPDQSDRPRDVG